MLSPSHIKGPSYITFLLDRDFTQIPDDQATPGMQFGAGSGVFLSEISTLEHYGAKFTADGQEIKQLLPRPRLWDPTKKFRFRALWFTSSTTTSQLFSLALFIRTVLGDEGTLDVAAASKVVTDAPGSVAWTSRLTDWSEKFGSLSEYGWTKDKDFITLMIQRVVGNTATDPVLKAIQIHVI